MKTKLIRDIPIGVLLIVLSVWCVTLVEYLAGNPQTLPLFGIVILSISAWKLMLVGFDVIVGIEIADKNGKE